MDYIQAQYIKLVEAPLWLDVFLVLGASVRFHKSIEVGICIWAGCVHHNKEFSASSGCKKTLEKPSPLDNLIKLHMQGGW